MSTLYSNPSNVKLQKGLTFTGLWNHREYRVIRMLGSGENGQVYLVESDGKPFALKMSKETMDLSYEIRSIQRINEAQGLGLGFSLFDVDDYRTKEGSILPFYVMTYKKGVTIAQFLSGKNEVQYASSFYSVLQLLQKFHESGFVCGDLKPEHLLVNPISKQISFVDYGGVTMFREGVRQYTELYDRGSWREGNRSADTHYDLFSVTMIFLQLTIGKQYLIQIFRDSRHVNTVCDIIPKIKKLRPIEKVLIKILRKEITTVNEAMSQMQSILSQIENLNASRTMNWIEWVFSFSVVFLVFSISVLFL